MSRRDDGKDGREGREDEVWDCVGDDKQAWRFWSIFKEEKMVLVAREGSGMGM
jgi:hypothetical protein